MPDEFHGDFLTGVRFYGEVRFAQAIDARARARIPGFVEILHRRNLYVIELYPACGIAYLECDVVEPEALLIREERHRVRLPFRGELETPALFAGNPGRRPGRPMLW